jgi:hypothetical protein
MVVDRGAIHDVAAVANFYVGVNIGERPHFNIVSQFGLGTYTGKGMDFVHNGLL